MNDRTLATSFGNLFRLLLPQIQLIILFALSIADWASPFFNNVKPQFLLMAVYYWAIYRPTLCSPAYVFALGIGLDLMSSMPVGASAILLVGFQWLIRDQRVFLMGQSYGVIWFAFMVISAIYACLEWCLYALFTLSVPQIDTQIYSVLITIFLFPPMSLLLILTHRFLPVDKN